MANLIIKPTSGGSLILQDEGGTAANTIDASGNTQLAGTLGVTGASTMTGNVTMAGTANNLGTVTAGTIASAVKVIDCDVDSWLSVLTATVDMNSDATIDFTTQAKLGSNVTESAGVHTVGTAGWYFIWCTLKNNGSTGDDTSARLYKNGSAVETGRIYWETSSTYDGETHIFIVEAAATNTFNMHGSGNWYGNTGTAAMSCFGGFRIGA